MIVFRCIPFAVLQQRYNTILLNWFEACVDFDQACLNFDGICENSITLKCLVEIILVIDFTKGTL